MICVRPKIQRRMPDAPTDITSERPDVQIEQRMLLSHAHEIVERAARPKRSLQLGRSDSAKRSTLSIHMLSHTGHHRGSQTLAERSTGTEQARAGHYRPSDHPRPLPPSTQNPHECPNAIARGDDVACERVRGIGLPAAAVAVQDPVKSTRRRSQRR